jgi:protein-S-isoprenylcysteine O-methyltransferase Ste14
MTSVQAIVFCLAFLCFATFAWGVRGVFVKKGQPSVGWTITKTGAFLSAIAECAAIYRSSLVYGWSALVGAIFFLLSLALFWACVRVHRSHRLSLAYSPDMPDHLVATGPYKVVRHPFYLSYLLAYVGGLVASRDVWLLLVVGGMASIYFDAARREEHKFLVSQFREDYRALRARTGMFLPNPVKMLRSTRPARTAA